MRVICDAPGQTCNRLWTYVASLADCIVNHHKMVVLFFDYTIVDFPNFRKSKYVYFPFYHPWYLNRGNGWNNFKGATWKLTHSEKWDKRLKKLGFRKGWDTRNEIENIPAAMKELQHIFTPREEICKEAENKLKGIKENCDIVIGVHIRRGDYATWNDGIFFYSHKEYRGFMEAAMEVFPGKKVGFFISTNEPVPQDVFDGLQVDMHNNGSAILDLHTLSLCDYIMGPYSTFSRWASFIGEKPLCWLDHVGQSMHFSKVLSFFRMEDGTTLKDW